MKLREVEAILSQNGLPLPLEQCDLDLDEYQGVAEDIAPRPSNYLKGDADLLVALCAERVMEAQEPEDRFFFHRRRKEI
ncbi:NADH pyrophosphatase [Aureococcus anophagefferens]|nr:NADH pyrophosphatase [Aureococcus anophagefferens]